MLDLSEKVTRQKNKFTLDIEDERGEAFKRCFALVCRRKRMRFSTITARSKQNLVQRVLHRITLLRLMLKLRVSLRFALGIFRKVLRIAQNEREKRADVLFLSNIRFISDRKSPNYLFEPLYASLARKRIPYKNLYYAQLKEMATIKRLLKRFIFRDESYIGDYYSMGVLLDSRRDMQKLYRRWQKLDRQPEFRNIFTHGADNFYDLIRPRFELVFKALSYVATDCKNIMTRVRDRENPSVLVMDHENNMYGKGYILLSCAEKKHKTLALSFELVFPASYAASRTAKRTSVDLSPKPDTKCVWGEYAYNIFLKDRGYPKQRLKKTGSPRFDLLTPGMYNCSMVRKKYALARKPYILVTTTIDHKNLETYNNIALKNPAHHWVIKPHPQEDEEKLRRFFDSRSKKIAKNITVVNRNADIYELLSCCEAILGGWSTTSLEAAILGKPILLLHLDNEKYEEHPYVPFQASLRITNIEQISGYLKLLHNKRQMQSIRKKLHKFAVKFHDSPPRNASEKVVAEIIRLLHVAKEKK